MLNVSYTTKATKRKRVSKEAESEENNKQRLLAISSQTKIGT